MFFVEFRRRPFRFSFFQNFVAPRSPNWGIFWEKMPPAQSTFCQLRQYRRYPAGLANFLLAEDVIGNPDRLERFFHFRIWEKKTKLRHGLHWA